MNNDVADLVQWSNDIRSKLFSDLVRSANNNNKNNKQNNNNINNNNNNYPLPSRKPYMGYLLVIWLLLRRLDPDKAFPAWVARTRVAPSSRPCRSNPRSLRFWSVDETLYCTAKSLLTTSRPHFPSWPTTCWSPWLVAPHMPNLDVSYLLVLFLWDFSSKRWFDNLPYAQFKWKMT